MAIEPDGKAPYAPPSAVLDVIERYRDRGLPRPIELDTLTRAGISESLAPRTLQALKLLELVDEAGNPTEQLEGLRKASEADFRSRLASVLESAYADVFQYTNPAEDGIQRVTDAFRHYKPPSQRARMVSLFYGLCEAAGLVTEPPRRPRGEPKRSPAKPKAKSSTRTIGSDPPHSIGRSTDTIPPELAGLFASLPDPKTGWPKERRDAFIEAFKGVLDFVIPVREAQGVPEVSIMEETPDEEVI